MGMFRFNWTSSRFDLRPVEDGSKSVKIKSVAARPLKIRFNPRNPQNPGSHPSTRGVAEHIEKGLMIYKTTPVMVNLISEEGGQAPAPIF